MPSLRICNGPDSVRTVQMVGVTGQEPHGPAGSLTAVEQYAKP